jgi:hypothetical protein
MAMTVLSRTAGVKGFRVGSVWGRELRIVDGWGDVDPLVPRDWVRRGGFLAIVLFSLACYNIEFGWRLFCSLIGTPLPELKRVQRSP